MVDGLFLYDSGTNHRPFLYLSSLLLFLLNDSGRNRYDFHDAKESEIQSLTLTLYTAEELKYDLNSILPQYETISARNHINIFILRYI